MGNSAIGSSWQDARKEIFTAEENAASDLRVSIILEMIKARRKLGYNQRKMEELSGVRQSSIARIENGSVMPTLSTLQKLLAPLGLKLAVVPE